MLPQVGADVDVVQVGAGALGAEADPVDEARPGQEPSLLQRLEPEEDMALFPGQKIGQEVAVDLRGEGVAMGPDERLGGG